MRVSNLTEGVPQAKAWRARLLQEIRKIQTQLRMPNRCDNRGTRLNVQQFRKWRSNALYAMDVLHQQRSELNAYIKRRMKEQRDASLAPHEQDVESLLLNLYRVNRRVLSQAPNLKLAEDEQILLDVIRGRFFLFDL